MRLYNELTSVKRCRQTVESAPLIETRRGGETVVPAIIAAAGENAARRFLEFSAVTIDNKNTRAAYFNARGRFFA